jgi:hypothetical protein
VQALQQPAGFASYEALRQRGQQTSHREVNYRTLYTIIHTKFKATLKVPRPSHITEAFQIFADAFAHAFPDNLNSLLLDNRGTRTAQRLQWPANVQDVRLSPYCLELNLIERRWHELQDDLAWLLFPNLEAQLVYIGNL